MSKPMEKRGWTIETQPHSADSQQVEVFVQSTAEPSLHFSFTFHFVDNEPYEGFCDPTRWEMLNERMKYKPSDILIISYPKCGTTWMEQIVLLLLSNGNESIMNPANKNTVQAQSPQDDSGLTFGKIWPDVAIEQHPLLQHHMGKQAIPITWDEFDNMPVQNRVLKSHSCPHMLLGSQHKGLEMLPEGMKVLIVTRNPFDACVSSYFYGFNAFRNGWPFDAWASVWLTGMVPMGSWFNFTQGWYEQHQRFPDKALWIHFEDLKQHPKQQIDRIAKYLDIESTSPSPAEYDQLLDKVVEFSSFSSMKAQAEAVDCKSTGHVDNHLRKGQCGDWKNFFDTNSYLYQAFVDKFHKYLDRFPSLSYDLGSNAEGGNSVLQTASK